ncbi:MAG: KH domain-containing protein [Methanomicrobiales archaeon]|jgi:ribosomal RNA assembly protein|nr:KH domain-containing protein [Methanomicrobiales archaeon]
MIQETRITGDRIGVLIGKSGITKKALEERTKTSITIDSEEGSVDVSGEDAQSVLRTVDVVTAINRGFSPERAFDLLDDEDLLLDVIDLSHAAETPRQLDRLRGRIIGKDGSAREQIERLTQTQVSVFGKTIALIGLPEQIKTARAAIEMIIKGVPHETVFSFLEKKKRQSKEDMISYYY